MYLVQFIAVVSLMELTPGPNMGYLVVLSLTQGRRAGLATVAGVATGLTVQAVIATVGFGAIIADHPPLYQTMRWLGIAMLAYLAVEAWREEREKPSEDSLAADLGRHFLRGFLTNVVNPKSLVFFIAVIPDFLPPPPDAALHDMIILVAIYLAIATAVHLALVLVSARIRPWLSSGRNQTLVRRASAVALAGMVVWLMLGT
ncbi:LysE family translocator [Oryzibacter oryziterrae]|uniref:LysE family translocator n=1 Tax=Oryzibacter oryziterrae TaxID=2766474 RepID=UPI001F3C10D2|nr:LysE family translocator [Oryzibacter oryziterrae]